MQYFKGDALEIKFLEAAKGLLDTLSGQKDAFFSGAYSTGPLGDVIYNSNLSPLSKAIKSDIFRNSFNQIFEGFTVAGSFESYLLVFRKIFGESTTIDFTVPAPGKLWIDIVADDPETSNLVSRYISNNQYVFDTLIDQSGLDEIMVQTFKGFQSQYELEQMLFEMVPAGIYTEITLTLGA